MSQMFRKILSTDDSVTTAILPLVLGAVFFAHGAQKMLGWFGGYGFSGTMGYFTQSELPFYYALADAFTICDGYHCSVLGPTDPNRLMAMSAWIDPAGTQGGPEGSPFLLGRVSASSDRVDGWHRQPNP